jgi:hypothetical protein
MKADAIKAGMAFSRNPIIVRDNFLVTSTDIVKGGVFSVTMSGLKIYEGRFYPPLRIDISEIVDANSDLFAEPRSQTEPIGIIESSEDFACRKVSVHAEYNGLSNADYEFIAVPGGVSKQNFRKLYKIGTDAFKSRFLNTEGNFFLTTRTAKWQIVIKETELYPLYFISPKDQCLKMAEGVTGQELVIDNIAKNTVYVLDINQLRRVFYDKYNVLSSVFDIYVGNTQDNVNDKLSSRIVIESADVSKERYRLRFRNSLGVFEIIELSGELSISPDFSDSEDNVYNGYDETTDDFISSRERMARKMTLSLQTRARSSDEILFLMDMMQSDEVYLLDMCADDVKVIPSVEDFTYKKRTTAPEELTITFELADNEENIMQDVIDGTESIKQKVFSNVFNDKFI